MQPNIVHGLFVNKDEYKSYYELLSLTELADFIKWFGEKGCNYPNAGGVEYDEEDLYEDIIRRYVSCCTNSVNDVYYT